MLTQSKSVCHPRPKRKQQRPSRYQRQLIRLRNDRPDVQQQNNSDNTAQLRDDPRQLYGRRRGLRASKQGRNSTSDDLLATPPDDRLNVETQRNVDRPLRVRTMSRRAQLSADMSDSDSDIETDHVTSHFRKRRNLAPAEFVQKTCRLEAIRLVACFTR